MVQLNFDAREVEPSSGFDPIPAGKYDVIITDTEMKPTKSGTGEYLEVSFQIIEGEHKGRMLWTRLNLDNPNATAVEIARKDLSAICHSVGVMTPGDTVELHGIPLVVNVICKKRIDTGEISNEIRSYEAKAVAQGQPAQQSNAVPPWKR